MLRVSDIYNEINLLYGFENQEQWDNSGLLVGSGENLAEKVCICLDVTKQVVEQAEDMGADLIISHHPVIFNGIKALMSDTAVYKLVSADISVISVHTPFDKASNGVCEALSQKIGLQNLLHCESEPALMIGDVPPTNTKEFAEKLRAKLGGRVLYSSFDREITKVAVCPGAGASFIPLVRELGADAFVTGDAGHHDFIDCEEMGIALFACGHFETEVIALENLKEELSKRFSSVEFYIAEQPNPIKYI